MNVKDVEKKLPIFEKTHKIFISINNRVIKLLRLVENCVNALRLKTLSQSTVMNNKEDERMGYSYRPIRKHLFGGKHGVITSPNELFHLRFYHR